jgi:hypothetical protein
MVITPEMIAFAQAIRARDRAIRKWLGRRMSYRLDQLPASLSPAPTNGERSRAELIEFVHQQLPPGVSYVAYLSTDRKQVATWVGDALATITSISSRRQRRSALTDERGSFRARGIDGRDYYGLHNGPGMYCRLRLITST